MSNFCGVLEDISNIIGTEATLKLAMNFGGTLVYLPKKPKKNSKLSQIVGYENLVKLSKEFGWGDVLIPMGHFRGIGYRRIQVAKMVEQGKSNNDIALVAGIHERTVRRTKNKNISSLPLLDYIEKLESGE